MTDARQYAPATQRNREPIGQVLQSYLNADARVLEIASGTGEHGVYFTEVLPQVLWQPSDVNPTAIASIQAWKRQSQQSRFLDPRVIDVLEPDWWQLILDASTHAAPYDAIVNINMVHISPWDATLGLFAGAQALLPAGGLLYLYGPFKQQGQHTAESNVAFDQSLQARDARWGVRNLDDIKGVAQSHGFEFLEAIAMPANNLSVLWRRLT